MDRRALTTKRMDRRSLIKGTGLAVMAGALGAGRPGEAVASREGRRNFLFVHGAWHAATHWNGVMEHLAAMGHRAFAIDLPGSGLNAAYPQSYLDNDFSALVTEPSPIAGIHLTDYRDAIADQVRRMARHGKVTLVGHSFGGLAITLVGEAVPQLIRRLVYLTAYVPVESLPNAVALASLPEGASSISGAILIGNPLQTGAQRINPRDADPVYLEKGRLALYNDVSTEEYIKFFVYCNPDLPLAVAFDDAHGTAQRWGRIPRTFIRCTEDHTVPLALQDRMITEADAVTPRNGFDVHTLVSSHSPFASMPDRLAELLSED
jgi:pimeloyl-ACP methyl ester carboxylesterase